MTWLIVKTSEMIFLALDTSAASKTSMTSKAFFLKKLPDLDDFIPPWHQNAQMSKPPECAATFLKLGSPL